MYEDYGQAQKIDRQFETLWAGILTKIKNEFPLTGSIANTNTNHSNYAASLQKDAGNDLEKTFNTVSSSFNSDLRNVYTSSYNYTNQVITDDAKYQPKAKPLTEREIIDALTTPRKGDTAFLDSINEQKTLLNKQISSLIDEMYQNKNNVNGNITKIMNHLESSKASLKKLLNTESEYFAALGVIDCCKQRKLDEYVFVAVIDKKTSSICKKHHLHIYPVQKAAPYVNMPPMHDNCRSSVIPFDKVDYERMKASKRLTGTNGDDMLESAYFTQWVFGYLSKNYPKYLPTGEKDSYYWSISLDIHSLLDIAGLAPVIGSAADIANLIVYLFEGDTLNAVIAAIAALPAADILKGLKTLGNVADAAGTAGKKAIKEGLERAAKTLAGNSGSVKIAKESLENTAELLGKEIAETAGEKAAKETAENVTGVVLDGAGKIVNSTDVKFDQRSIDHAFGKHNADFGSYPNGSKTSVNQFTNDLKNFIDSGIQKAGTYRSTPGTHIYNPNTNQWVFINSDGTFNAAFKLSAEQFKYLIETGVVK